jgi:hypothetical protein
MGLKDRLLAAKCKIGVHSGEWKQLAAGSCDEQRTCVHCGQVANRTDHHMSDWAYSADPAAPPCTQERHCERCPEMRQEVRHTMQWRYDYEGRHEPCRQRLECTECGFTEGKTMLNHNWSDPVEWSEDGTVYRLKKLYTCEVCRRQVARDRDSLGGPRHDARDYV